MRKEDDDARPRPRLRPGRPLLTAATTTGMASLMAGCIPGNPLPPPPIELCFEPTTALVVTQYQGDWRSTVRLDEDGCGQVTGEYYYYELEASAEGYCTLRTNFDHLYDGLRITLTPGACPLPDLGVPEQGVPADQGATDAAPDADSADLGSDADLPDGG